MNKEYYLIESVYIAATTAVPNCPLIECIIKMNYSFIFINEIYFHIFFQLLTN